MACTLQCFLFALLKLIVYVSSMGEKDVPTSHNANPSNDPAKFAKDDGSKMQALAWSALLC